MPTNPRPLMPSSASSTDNFWDDLTASKNDQLRSTMNSGISNIAPVGVVAPKERTPQSIDEIKEEREAIILQNAEASTNWNKFKAERKNEKTTLMLGIGLIAYMMIVD